MENYERVISKIVSELDKEQADYQFLYKKLHGRVDDQSKIIYKLMLDLCFRIRKEIKEQEGA